MSRLGRVARGCGCAIAVLGLALVAALVGLYLLGRSPKPLPPPQSPSERAEQNLKVFDAAWGAIDRNYFDRDFHGLDWQAVRREYRPRAAAAKDQLELYGGVLAPMAMQLADSHVRVTPPPPGKPVQPADLPVAPGCTPPTLSGNLGFSTGRSRTKEALLVVTEVLKGTPAERAGLAPGDEIVAEQFRFEPCRGVQIRLTLLEPTGRREVLFDTAPSAPVPPVAARTLPGGIRLLRFDTFDEKTAAWLFAELDRPAPAGVILDLRRNGGGKARTARLIGGVFLGDGVRMGAMVRHGRARTITSRDVDWIDRLFPPGAQIHRRPRYAGPLAVLVGPASASSAEVLAASLRHHGRAVIVGERSAGATQVARYFDLPDGGRMQVSVARYEAPDGRPLEDAGVAPDVEARQTLPAIRADRDLVAEAAARTLARPEPPLARRR